MRWWVVWAVVGIFSLAGLVTPTVNATTLTVMDWKINETEQTQRWFQYVKERFEAENPGVKVEYLPVNWEEVREKLLTGVAAGTAPDVVALSIVWARELYDLGALLPLNDLIARTPEVDPSEFIPVTQVYNQKDGVYFGITNAMDSAALLYDIDAFESTGLDPHPEALATWDDFVAAARRLVRQDAGGAITRYAYATALSPEAFNSWLVSNGIPRIAIVGGVYPYLRFTDLDAHVWAPIVVPALSGESDLDTALGEAQRLYDQILTD